MTVKTLSGATVEIGPAATSVTDTKTEYDALTPYVVVGEVEDMGEMGDESATILFSNVGAARVRKLKGARDAGTMVLVCGADPADAGQLALKAAEKTKLQYALRITMADKITTGGTNTIFYLQVTVLSARNRMGTNDNIVRTVFNLGINENILEVAAT
jgi:hypothetical protein